MTNENNGGDIPQTDEVLSATPQELSPIHIIGDPVIRNVVGPVGSTIVGEDPAVKPVEVEVAPAGAVEASPGSDFNFPAPDPIGNAIQEKAVYAPLDKAWDEDGITLVLPPDTHARTSNYLDMQPNIDITKTDAGAQWMALVEAGLEAGSYVDSALGAAKRVEASYRQRITHGDKKLEAGIPRIGDDGPKLTGERGILRVNALLGRGSIIQIPLWHSGFWITFKCPKETQLQDMHQRMADEKIKFGRITHGLAFANYTVFSAAALVDLAMECTYETSVKDLTSGADLRSMISSLDLNTIAWGMACAIWPRGFQYTRSLLDESGQKTNTIQEKLNVGSLLWVDDNSIDDWQRGHMANRTSSSMTKEAVKIYREHFTRGKSKSYSLDDKISMTLRVPSLDQFLNAGQLWVNETVAGVNAAFTQETSQAQRNQMILNRGKATSLRQYVHWVESFEFPTLNKVMDDEPTIAEECSSLSGDDVIREKYYEVMREFINDSTIAIIATPLANDEEKKQTSEKFPWLLPLDPISTFFILLSQKVAQIQQRP